MCPNNQLRAESEVAHCVSMLLLLTFKPAHADISVLFKARKMQLLLLMHSYVMAFELAVYQACLTSLPQNRLSVERN